MVSWKYNPEDYGRIKPIEPGQYRVRIEKAEDTVSKNTGKDMIKLTLKVSGYNQFIWHYIVFDPNNVERTNNNLGRIFDSFEIEPGNLNVLAWQGKVGAADIKNEVDNRGEMRSAINFFLRRKDQAGLPPWQEHQTKSNVNSEMVNADDGLSPF